MSACPSPSKIAHPTKRAAIAHMRALHGVGGSVDLWPYRCPSGEHWHVGHSQASLGRRIRNALRRAS